MATITRRYTLVGPTDAMIARYVEATGVVAATFPTTTVDITVTNDTDVIATLDEYMATLGFEFNATATAKQVFTYTRQVGDTDIIVINAAAGFLPRASANYIVQVTMGEFTELLVASAPPSLYTTTQFTLKLSAPPVAGDTFLFTIEDLT